MYNQPVVKYIIAQFILFSMYLIAIQEFHKYIVMILQKLQKFRIKGYVQLKKYETLTCAILYFYGVNLIIAASSLHHLSK